MAGGRLLPFDFALAEDCLDPGDFPLGLDDLAGCLEAFRLALTYPRPAVARAMQREGIKAYGTN